MWGLTQIGQASADMGEGSLRLFGREAMGGNLLLLSRCSLVLRPVPAYAPRAEEKLWDGIFCFSRAAVSCCGLCPHTLPEQQSRSQDRARCRARVTELALTALRRAQRLRALLTCHAWPDPSRAG